MVVNPFESYEPTSGKSRHALDVKPPRLAISKKPLNGVKWKCPRCALRYPAWITATNTIQKSDQCFDKNDSKVPGGGCPACLKGKAAKKAARHAFAAETPVDEERFDPAHPPKLKPGEYAVSFQFRQDARDIIAKKAFGDQKLTIRSLQMGASGRDLVPELRAQEPQWEDLPAEGYIVRDYETLDRVKRKLYYEWTVHFGNKGLRSSSTGRTVYNTADDPKPNRKWLKVVDHLGVHVKLADLDALFPAPAPKVSLYTSTPKLFAPSINGHLEAAEPVLEPITEEVLRDVWRVMIPDAVLDEDPYHALIGLTPGCLQRLDAFNARREALRKDGAPVDGDGRAIVTRLYHGTCAHRIRLIMRHGLERSASASNPALGAGIYFGQLAKARGFAHACGEPHYLQGYAEGERIGRMYSETVAKLSQPTVIDPKTGQNVVRATGEPSDIVDPMQAALTFVLLKTIEHYPDLEMSTKTKRGGTRTFNNVASRLTPVEKKRFDKLHIWQRVRFVLEVDVLLGKSYELDGDWERSENKDIPRRVLRRGHHSVHCVRFKQDEWAVYRPDQCLLRGIRALVDEEEPK